MTVRSMRRLFWMIPFAYVWAYVSPQGLHPICQKLPVRLSLVYACHAMLPVEAKISLLPENHRQMCHHSLGGKTFGRYFLAQRWKIIQNFQPIFCHVKKYRFILYGCFANGPAEDYYNEDWIQAIQPTCATILVERPKKERSLISKAFL